MLTFKRILLFIILFVVGIIIIKYRERIARTIGKNDLAEKYLGMGGTYVMWVIIGVIVMIVGTSVMLGKCSYMGL